MTFKKGDLVVYNYQGELDVNPEQEKTFGIVINPSYSSHRADVVMVLVRWFVDDGGTYDVPYQPDWLDLVQSAQ